MRKYLKEYTKDCAFEKYLNTSLMNKDAEPPLVEFVKESWKSLEVVPNIKITGFEYTEEESEIDPNKYIHRRDKKKRKDQRYDYKYINDDRVGKLVTTMEITVKEKDEKTGEVFEHRYPFKKAMLIPLMDENGYLTIKGKKYYLIYQMVEKSTYTASQSVTLKSLMPIAVKRYSINITPTEAEQKAQVLEGLDALTKIDPDASANEEQLDVSDVYGKVYRVPIYYVIVLKKEIPVVLFYMAQGIHVALNMLQVDNVMEVVPEFPDDPDPDCLYFKISGKCYLKVLGWAFEKYPFVKSVVGGILGVVTNRTSISQLDDGRQWIKRIANPVSYEKGADILKFFNRLLDQTTARVLKLYQYHKKDIYTLLRWICQEYNTLRLKDNLSLANKRLRCMETAVAPFNMEFSMRLYRIMSLGDKATIENFKEMFKWSGNMLISKLFDSGMLSFDDSVNDLTFFKHFKYTTKGPQSLGNKNGNNVSSRYRSIHPSHLGKIDILVCGHSDPGRNGLLSPWSTMDSLNFDDSIEVGDFLYNLEKDLAAYYETKHKFFIRINFDNEEDYYNAALKMQEFNENIKIYGTTRENHIELVVDTEDYFNDENPQEPVEGETKKKRKAKI